MSGNIDAAPARTWRGAPDLAAWMSRRPQWWLFSVAAAGWLVLVGFELVILRAGNEVPAVSGGDVGAGGALEHAGLHEHAGDIGSGSWVGSPLVAHGVLVLAMVAIMTPLVASNVKYAALRSPRRVRLGVSLAVTWGWASMWVVVAVGLAGLAWLPSVGLGRGAAILGVTMIAVGWQWTGVKQRSVARCHQMLAPPLSLGRACRAGHRYGLFLGRNCVVSCLPLMALMTVCGHRVVVAGPLAGLAWYERRRRPHHDLAPGSTSVAVAAVGAGAALLVDLGVL